MNALPNHEIVPTEPDALAEEAPNAEVIIPARTPIDAATIALASSLRLIQQFGIGVDHVDLEAARVRGVPVANAPAGPSGIGKAVAEFALMHLIAAGRQLPTHLRTLAARSIAVPFGASLFDARVCIVGVGGVGSEIAKLLKPFGGDPDRREANAGSRAGSTAGAGRAIHRRPPDGGGSRLRVRSAVGSADG